MIAVHPLEERYKAASGRRALAVGIGLALQAIRREEVPRFTAALEAFWRGQARRAVSRLRALMPRKELKQTGGVGADDILPPSEDRMLTDVARGFVVEIIAMSWDVWNVALGTSSTFNVEDPAVRRAIRRLEVRMRRVNDETRQAVREVLTEANRHGWGIDKIVRGDANLGIRGLRDVVEETYHNRARAVARTELGFAQQDAAVTRYGEEGVERVLVLDDGFPNSHPTCVIIGNQGRGTVVSLEWAQAHPIQHPNCVRCFAPYFGDARPEDPDIPVWG